MQAERNRPAPGFAGDPYGWFSRIGREIGKESWPDSLHDVQPAVWAGEHGNAWRIIRSTTGVEIRPALISPFIRYSDSPRVSAIAIGEEIEVELTCRQARWVDRFPLGSFDVAALGHTMLNEQELPHDNLPRLFPPKADE